MLTDVNLSEASEAHLGDACNKKFSYSLHSDGDSYPNSPINGESKQPSELHHSTTFHIISILFLSPEYLLEMESPAAWLAPSVLVSKLPVIIRSEMQCHARK